MQYINWALNTLYSRNIVLVYSGDETGDAASRPVIVPKLLSLVTAVLLCKEGSGERCCRLREETSAETAVSEWHSEGF